MDYSDILQLEGVMQGELARINKINNWYSIYDGKQEWKTKGQLDYEPTKKVTNYIKKLIDKRARFMLGKEPFFNFSGDNEEQAQAKEDLFQKILDDNKWHSKLLKARKDCSIGGKVAVKLWADKDKGLKIIFAPAQEFIVKHNLDDVDEIEEVIFFYALNDEQDKTKQRIKRQSWKLENNKCIVNEGIYNGYGKLVETVFKDFYNGLDFIPVIVIQNGGLTGDTKGYSDVEMLWQDQDSYNKLKSDDIDALKFQMFGQTTLTDADQTSIDSLTIAPGAVIDLQTDLAAANQGRQAKAERLESNFSYGNKYEETIRRVKSDMYDLMDIPDTSLEQLKGMMASGKSMRAVYWDLMATCDEDWTEWGPAFEEMAEFIFKLIEVYNLYNAKSIAKAETELKIERYYPIPEDEIEQRKMDLDEVIANVRSKQAYIDKWSDVEDVEKELEQIKLEKQEEDSYSSEM
ncbi:MAG: phage portal protein [Peptoniphilaceae bacterium]